MHPQALPWPDIRRWQRVYGTDENERYFEAAFDHILKVTGARPGAFFLDAGCGGGKHAVRLARRGFRVHAVDLQAVVPRARRRVREAGCGRTVTVEGEDIMRLSCADGSFDHVLCWGVLMHIPEVARAITELARVLKPGGCLIISETNMLSPEAALEMLSHRRARGRAVAARRTPAGIEYRTATEGVPIMWRRANPRWLVEEVEAHGLRLERRLPGQLTEAYTRARRPALRRTLHTVNGLWLRRVRLAPLAASNVFGFRKPG